MLKPVLSRGPPVVSDSCQICSKTIQQGSLKYTVKYIHEGKE